jgi:hypothetical protein
MIMPSGLRKAALTAHIIASIGWIGAVAAFLALALTGTMSQDPELVRAVDLAMGVITWWVIVPSAFLGLVTGIVSSLFTKWGLFRYYWVVLKLLMTVVATLVLLEHTKPIALLAGAATRAAALGMDLSGAQRGLVTDAAAGLVVLLILTVLSVYKPRGLTPYGQWKQDKQRLGDGTEDAATAHVREMVQEQAATSTQTAVRT